MPSGTPATRRCEATAQFWIGRLGWVACCPRAPRPATAQYAHASTPLSLRLPLDGWHQAGSVYGQCRVHLAQRFVDQQFSIVIGDASDRVVYLYAASLQFSIKLVRLQFFGVLCAIVVVHGDPPLRTSAPRAK
jgi:hypothetical protein